MFSNKLKCTHGQRHIYKKNSFFDPNKPLNDHKDLILPNTTEDHLRWSVVTVDADADITEFHNSYLIQAILL